MVTQLALLTIGGIGGAVLMWLRMKDRQVIVETSSVPSRYQLSAWRKERLEVNPNLWRRS